MLLENARHLRPRRATVQRVIAATVVAGACAGLPVLAAGGASAQTPSHPAVTVAAAAAMPSTAAAQAAPAAAPAHQAAAYTVVSGDWLSKIAAAHGVQGGWQKLYELNKSVLTKGPDLIFPGQTLTLSGASAKPGTSAPAAGNAAKAAPKAGADTQAKPSAPTTKAVSQDAQRSSRSANRSTLPATAPAAPAAPAASVGSGSLQALAASIVPADQLASFDQIIQHESGWNVTATNPSSGAYGLPQSLPGNKMASAGADWRTNPATQIKWALNYMNTTYGSPNQAWAFWQTHHAY